MNRKVVLCDRYDENRKAIVIADCTYYRMIISKSQLKSAKRRSRMITGSYLVISGENDSEFLEKTMEVYDDSGKLCEIIKNY